MPTPDAVVTTEPSEHPPATWTAQEQALWRCFRSGTELDLRQLGGGPDPDDWQSWAPERTIGADALATLLLTGPPPELGRSAALRVNGARISGRLSLDGATVVHQIELWNCHFEEAVQIRGARTRRISLAGSRVPELRLHNIDVDGELAFERIRTNGLVDLADASIARSVRFMDARLTNHHGPALMAERLRTGGALLCQGLDATGEIRLPGARIGGIINLAGAQLRSGQGTALDGNGLSVGGTLFCDPRRGRSEGLRTVGRVFLGGARIDGDLDLTGAVLRLSPDPDGRWRKQPAGPRADADSDPTAVLVAERAVINGNLEMDGNFKAYGVVRLATASIKGNIRATECLIDPELPEPDSGEDRFALLGDGLELGGELLCSPGFEATGEILMRTATIGGGVFLADARISNPGRNALNFDRTTVQGNLSAVHLTARGTVRLQNAVIGGSVLFDGATLTDAFEIVERRSGLPSGASVRPCLDARSIQVGRDFHCQGDRRGPFSVSSGVRLRGADVRKSVSFRAARLDSGGRIFALNLFGMRSTELVLAFAAPPVGAIELSRTRVAAVYDNAHLWSATGGVRLDGFEYGGITVEQGNRALMPLPGGDVPENLYDQTALIDSAATTEPRVRGRVRWLRAALAGNPSAASHHRWLRRWLKPDGGHGGYTAQPYEQLASMYRAEGNDREARYVLLANQRHRRTTQSLPARFVGRLLDAIVGYGYRTWLALGWLAGLWALGYGYMSRLSPAPVPLDADVVAHWSPGLFTLDLLLPIIGFEQEGVWSMIGPARWVAAGLEVAGWLLATAVLAGLTRVLQRRDA